MKTWLIYTLEDPRGGGVRYVGVTHRTLKARLAGHLSLARKSVSYHSINWIRKLQSEGVTPVILAIESGWGPDWGRVETKWISWYREQGCALTNATTGGDGAPGHTMSLAARAKVRAAQLGRKHTPEHRAKVAAGNRGKKMSPEAIAKTAAASRGRKHTPEAIAKMREARLGKKGWVPDPETLARRAISIKEALDRKRASGWSPSPSAETRAKISASTKGVKRSPETRARMSAATKAVRAREKEAGRINLGSSRPCPLCGKPRHRQSKSCRKCWANQRRTNTPSVNSTGVEP